MPRFNQGAFIETDVASATTCNIASSTVLSTRVNITGTTTITGFGSAAKRWRLIRFAGVLTLTHNATSLILPGGTNITTAAGDTCEAMSDASGNWRIYNYQRASGKAVIPSAFSDITSKPTTLAGYGITDGATDAEVAAAVAALVDSAPGALDTLNELAAALGDDANFASTVTTALGTKAKIADVQRFTSSGTWTKPSGAKMLRVIATGGGGGGGAGGKAASGVAISGGGGGGGAARVEVWIEASETGSTETVTVGDGGSGLAGATSELAGPDATAGGTSSFGSFCSAFGGGLASGGSASSASGGGGGGSSRVGGGNASAGTGGTSASSIAGGAGGSGGTGTNATGVTGGGGGGGAPAAGGNGGVGAASFSACGGGGAGGGVTAANAFGNGGVAAQGHTITSNAAGTTEGASATGGSPETVRGGSGGGGGAGSHAGNGGNGAAGEIPGGGGGGGGSAHTGNGGAGGSGARGEVLVITYF